MARCDLVFSDTATADLTPATSSSMPRRTVAMADAPKLTAGRQDHRPLPPTSGFADLTVFEKWYKLPHGYSDLAAKAALRPGRAESRCDPRRQHRWQSRLLPDDHAVGYYPLLKAGIIDAGHLIADCASGVSGAGKKAEMDLIFSEASDNFRPTTSPAIAINRDRARLQEMTGDKVRLIFTPHLTPMIRGMHSTLYAQLNAKGLPMSNEAVQALFEDAYRDEPFVDVMPFGSTPDTRSTRQQRAAHCIAPAAER